ncbi:type II toxin-antitoxin system RelE/ParE family toxin [Novosphingobium olei]|uniref:Type II toxin-antitoxin system RelE/ParE family toxin n=1 Tax=Novosphingobium olei TaxID=2728851 RepID=A0A7Y0GC84_9SPHN|nr:type II toxin-antitoxin system RelE/ParE family toxin [Novosphingobium olei]NML95888.1 type II toxin-antitoxin system RelE/ParE family toxin [Novosphingobium olei]
MAKQRRAVVIAQGAEDDLAGIYRRRIAQRGAGGSDGADALLDEIVRAIESLGEYPLRGAVPVELEALGIQLYRQLSPWPWRIIYLPEETRVTVLVIADARRDFRTLLEERLLR